VDSLDHRVHGDRARGAAVLDHGSVIAAADAHALAARREALLDRLDQVELACGHS
jgi:hypothetical protein